MKLINIGFGNMVNGDRVIAIVSPDSAPIKRLVQDAREKGALIDASYGRSTRAVPLRWIVSPDALHKRKRKNKRGREK